MLNLKKRQFEAGSHILLTLSELKNIFSVYLYIYLADLQESVEGTIHKPSNYPDFEPRPS